MYAYVIEIVHNEKSTDVGVIAANDEDALEIIAQRYEHLDSVHVGSVVLYTLQPATITRCPRNGPLETFKGRAAVVDGYLFYETADKSRTFTARCGKSVYQGKITCYIFHDDHHVLFDK